MHTIPQNVTSYEDRIVGMFVGRQFIYLAIGGIIAFLLLTIGSGDTLPFRFFGALLIAAFSAALALLKINDRNFDVWALSYLRAVTGPTEWVWLKQEPLLSVLAAPDVNLTTQKQQPASHAQQASHNVERKEQFKSYLSHQQGGDLDPGEEAFLAQLNFSAPVPHSAFAMLTPRSAAPPMLTPKNPTLPKPAPRSPVVEAPKVEVKPLTPLAQSTSRPQFTVSLGGREQSISLLSNQRANRSLSHQLLSGGTVPLPVRGELHLDLDPKYQEELGRLMGFAPEGARSPSTLISTNTGALDIPTPLPSTKSEPLTIDQLATPVVAEQNNVPPVFTPPSVAQATPVSPPSSSPSTLPPTEALPPLPAFKNKSEEPSETSTGWLQSAMAPTSSFDTTPASSAAVEAPAEAKPVVLFDGNAAQSASTVSQPSTPTPSRQSSAPQMEKKPVESTMTEPQPTIVQASQVIVAGPPSAQRQAQESESEKLKAENERQLRLAEAALRQKLAEAEDAAKRAEAQLAAERQAREVLKIEDEQRRQQAEEAARRAEAALAAERQAREALAIEVDQHKREAELAASQSRAYRDELEKLNQQKLMADQQVKAAERKLVEMQQSAEAKMADLQQTATTDSNKATLEASQLKEQLDLIEKLRLGQERAAAHAKELEQKLQQIETSSTTIAPAAPAPSPTSEVVPSTSTVRTEPVPAPKDLPTLTTGDNVVSGFVFDQNGQFIDGAVVVLKDDRDEPKRALKTNKLGQFIMTTPLPNGRYTVGVDKKGWNFDIMPIELQGKPLPAVVIRGKSTE